MASPFIDPNDIERDPTPITPATGRVGRSYAAEAGNVAEGIESIRQARRTGAHLKRFPLKRTGGVAIVRRPSLLSLAVNGQIPAHLREMVNAMVLQGARQGQKALEDDFLKDDPMGKMADLMRSTAIVGFANPRLVPDSHAGPLPDDAMYVSEIEIDDLGDYFWWCQRDEEEKAKSVATFPSDQADAVPPGPHLSPVRAETV